MQPCCLETRPNVAQSECSVRSLIGGATSFREGACPRTAEEGHQAMQPVALEEESQGCCFSIGFGDLMRPCCLETEPNVGLSSCSVGQRIGGATGFRQEGCPNTAEEAHRTIQPVDLKEESHGLQEMPQGCCFSFGYGSRMQPCSLQTSPNVELSACNVGNRIGGATGFSQDGCPSTAEEAHEAIQPADLEAEIQGCCFSFGFGDRMQPCCLQTSPNALLSACNVGNRMGGATGFTQDSCPSTAGEAHEAIQPVVLEEEPQGCCFSFGLGAFMRPCCLQTSPNVQRSACDVENREGGSTVFTEGVCPTTAEEAQELLQHAESASANHSMTNLLSGTRHHVEASSALSLPLVSCVSFVFGSFVSVIVMTYRRQNRDDGNVFMQLDA